MCSSDLEAGRLVVDPADRHGDGGVGVPALDDRPAVDREDVALLEDPGTRDAVDDDLVRRRADDRREAVVAEEVRARAPSFDDLTGRGVDLGGGDAGSSGGGAHLVHLGDDATGAPHTDMLFTSERIKKVGANQLEDVVTIHDPDYYTRDFQVRFTYNLRNNIRLEDYVCGEKHRDISNIPGVRRP